MSSITAGNATQYGDSRKLAVRAALHKYTVAETSWFSWVAQQLPFKPGDRVLDVGCGPAWFWAAIAGALPANIDLTLSDLSPGMVEEAVKRCQALPFGSVRGRQADAAALPVDDGEFDAVVCMHMLYHLADRAAGIAEMHRVLRPGGFLAVTTNGAGMPSGSRMKPFGGDRAWTGSPAVACAARFDSSRRGSRTGSASATVSIAASITARCSTPPRSSPAMR
jgi:SAM-dependent methyltransferase